MFANVVIAFGSVYMIWLASCISTKNWQSSLVFKFFPMVIGVCLGFVAMKNFGVL